MPDMLYTLIDDELSKHSATDSKNLFGVSAPSERRRAIVTRLLVSATDIVTQQGFSALTFRKLAKQCSMSLSNLQYYFPSSEALIHAMLRFIISQNLQNLRDSTFPDIQTPEDRLRAFFEFLTSDIRKKKTNALFTAIWDLAQRDRFVADKLDKIYSVEIALLTLLLAEINPTAKSKELSEKAGVISALFEGMMPVFGPASALDIKDGIHLAAVRHACQIAGIAPK